MGKRKRRRGGSRSRRQERATPKPTELPLAEEASGPESSAVPAAALDVAPNAAPDPGPSPAPNVVEPEAKPSPRVVPFGSGTPLRALEPERPATMPPATIPPTTIPRSMRWALLASVGAALLSASVALYVVMREPDVGLHDAAAAVPTTAHAVTPPTEVPSESAEPSPGAEREPASEPEPVPAVAWPDMQLGALPPVGAAPESMGQSAGSPRDGALLRPVQLPAGRGYVIRNPQTAWGTRNTIDHLRTAIKAVRTTHPALHQLVIGDISTRRGGPLSGHQSHQAGRDVDVGLWYRPQTEEFGPSEFLEGTSKNIDRKATYDLIAALATTVDEPDGVELIVLDYNLQRVLRRFAMSRGVPETELEALFQFPHGPNSRHGLVRHMPAHRDHLHVRFKCPPGDAYCRDPLIGFGGMEATEEPATVPMGI